MSVNITLGADPAVNEIREYFVTDFRKPYSKRVGISQSETLSSSEAFRWPIGRCGRLEWQSVECESGDGLRV